MCLGSPIKKILFEMQKAFQLIMIFFQLIAFICMILIYIDTNFHEGINVSKQTKNKQ